MKIVEFIKEYPVTNLKEWDRNPRKNNEASEKLAKIIEQHGFINPIIIDQDGIIRAGHTRLKAAFKANIKYVPILKVDFENEAAAIAYAIADNKSNEWAEWDFKELKELLADLDNFDFDIEMTGFTEEEMGDILTYESKEKIEHRGLKEDFLFPPFSVLDGRKDDWLNRKKQWIDFGITSEIGRGNNLTFSKSLDKYSRSPTNKDGEKINTSVFDPVIAELVYKWFGINNGKILDPFAGGSVRGIVASKLGYEYYGNDLREEQIKANIENAENIGVKMPKWTSGDSRNIDKLIDGEDFDLVFTCPPYVDLEKYSDDESDLSNMEYDKFLKVYKEIIEKTIKKLKNDRFAVIVVGDVRNKDGAYYNFIGDTKKIFLDSGMVLYNEIIKIDPYGTAPVRARKYFTNRKLAKVHQNILVFYKGNIKSIKNNYKDIDFTEILSEKTDI